VNAADAFQSGLSVGSGGRGAGRRAGAAALGQTRIAGSAARIDKWRADNPDAFRWWETKHGCVIQFWGMRVYYGTCRDCPALVTARRCISKNGPRFKSGPTQLGRWPMLCGNCRCRVEDVRRDRKRKYMANTRRRQYAIRDEQYRAGGGTPPRQGVPASGRPKAIRERKRCFPWETG
jgi:hypothetical protein